MTIEERVERLEKMVLNEVQIPIEVAADEDIPVYANATDAGADLHAAEDMEIAPGKTMICKTGIKVAIPEGYEIQIRPRSGLSLKTGIRVANAPGTIDAGYRNEVGIILTNTGNEPFVIRKGDRIAQMVVAKIYHAVFVKVPDVTAIGTDRGGGFGHTGV